MNLLQPTIECVFWTVLVQIPGPKILHCITKKGKGYELAEQEQTKWHATTGFEKSTGKATSKKSIVPEALGLKFAIPLTFIAIIINELRKLDHLIVMIISGLAATLFYNVPFKSYIMIWWSNFVVDDTKESKKTLRRWKRIIRCNDEDIKKIHAKTKHHNKHLVVLILSEL